MEKRERSEAEQTATDAANKIFGNMLNLTRRKDHRRRSAYIFWEAPDQRMFCYMPWKDGNGDYWTWVMKPYGKGALSGNAKNWKKVGKSVRSRTRKTARKRAQTRYKNWLDYLGQKYEPKRGGG